MGNILNMVNIKTVVAVLVVAILLAAIPVTTRLTQQQTQLKSKAATFTGSLSVTPNSVQKNSSGSYPDLDIAVGTSSSWKVFYFNPGICGSNCDQSTQGWSEILSGTGSSIKKWPPPSYITGTHTFALMDAAITTIADKENVEFKEYSGGGTGSGTVTVSPSSITQSSGGSWPQLSISVSTTSSDSWKVLFCEQGVYGTDCTISSGWSGIRDGTGNSNFTWTPPNNNYSGSHTIALMRWVAGQTPVVWSSKNVTFTPYSGGGTGSGTVTVSPSSITQKADGSWSQLSISVSTTSTDPWKVLFYNPGVCGTGCTVSDGWSSIRDGSGNTSFTWTPPAGSYKSQHSIAVMRWVAGQTPVIWDKDTVTFTPYSGGGPAPGTGTVSSPQVVAGGSRTSGVSSCLEGGLNSCWWDKVNISTTTSGMNGGILYFHEGECTLTSCGSTGWTELARYSSDGSNTKTWQPNSGDIPPGRHTFGLWAPDGSRAVAVDHTDFKENAAECNSVVFKEGGTQVTTSLVVGKTYDVEITMENKDYQVTSYSGPTWTPGNLSAGTGYFLGFPTGGDSGAGDFKTNTVLPSSEGGIYGIWDISFTDKAKLRFPVSRNVPAGSSETFKFQVTPKRESPPGQNHTFYWGMIHEEVAWFGGQCLIEVDVDPASGGGATPTPTPTPTPPTPTPTPPGEIAQPGTQCYFITEDLLAKDSFQSCADSRSIPYTEHPTRLSYTFLDQTPGIKTIFVRFIAKDGSQQDFQKAIRFQPEGAITNITCNYAPEGSATLISITGTNLGSHSQQGEGGITVAGKKTQVTWDEGQTTISMPVPERLQSQIPILLQPDGGEVIRGSCVVNLATLGFTANIQCRPPGNLGSEDVEVRIYENVTELTGTPRPIITQEIVIDRNGVPQRFTPQLEEGKSYTVIIKAPGTVARSVVFTASDGTVIVPEPIILPVGNIFPITQADSQINTLDYSELIRQWTLVEDVTRNGDFNKDKRVNSVDYSCMRPNLNTSSPTHQDEEFIPETATQSAILRSEEG